MSTTGILTRMRRVKHWQTFARSWWLYDAKWQDPFDSGILIARYLMGKHKPVYSPDIDCGDFVVVINASQIALPNEEWRWRHFFHDTQYARGRIWASAWEMHIRDPTFVLERAIYRYSGKDLKRYQNFARLTLLKEDDIPESIKPRICGQIRQLRPVPRKLEDIPQEELDKFPKIFDYDAVKPIAR